jgi:hypothetical protein
VDRAGGVINLVSLAALTTENLHLLYVIGMQNRSVRTRSNMAVIVIGKDIVVKFETDIYLV